ncbi:TPA: FAD:protein FMN transferase [Methanosarcina acetivorans]|uniref:FAD:protein FMN transferase n=2 Tax=Methanosarcina acetivorans TaxID=2214 RepID=Q8TSY6_METAC|nr:FAD:protein FMN transferase [Methanosarcina acetivorans]AAM04099.1 membrane protein [Methanosarcina acetivorans C2A]HIH95399.1 FAD:protein FMN transferase [Methanosarcina acetivorans]
MDLKYKTPLAFLLVISILASGCVQSEPQEEKELQEFQQTKNIMDTTVTVAVYAPNESEASKATDDAFSEIYRIDALMSPSKEDSQLTILNTVGEVENADPDFIYVLEQSKYYSEKSGGAFDITIQPVLDLWKSKFLPGGSQEPPTADELNETLKLVNYSKISIENGTVSLEPGMKIALGGIAKGYAVDKAIEALEEDGIENAFVNAGGDGKYIGQKSDGTPWVVGLQNPDRSGQYVTAIEARDIAVATSGNYERYFNESAKVSHISDPRTGYPSEGIISSTVIAGNAIDADSFATAIFVLGEEEGLEMIENLEGVECLIITEDRRLVYSSGFKEYETED